MWLSDLQKIGLGLLLFGMSFICLGILLFFDKGLVAIGDVTSHPSNLLSCSLARFSLSLEQEGQGKMISFLELICARSSPRARRARKRWFLIVYASFLQLLSIASLPCLLGPKRFLSFLAQKQKIRGTSAFTLGIILVLIKWPKLGLLLQSLGAVNLFG